MQDPLSLLDILTRRLDATSISSKSAQVIPYAWSTGYDHVAAEHDIGQVSCDCPWRDRLTQFCGLYLVHQNQDQCPSCGQKIVHVQGTLPLVDRLMQVARRLSPRGELVDHTQRSRASVQCLRQALQIQMGSNLKLMMGHKKQVPVDDNHPRGIAIVYEQSPFSRVVIIASDVRLEVWSPKISSPANVVYSDGIEPLPGYGRGYSVSYKSLPEAANTPVIFSISGQGTRLLLEPLDKTIGMVLYELTVTTGEGTIVEPPGLVHMYPELRRLQGHVPSALHTLVSVTDSPSQALMHSSNNWIQAHDLVIWRANQKDHLIVTLAGDAVLTFFDQEKRLLRVYTGNNVYRLVVLFNKCTGAVTWYSMRETIAIDDYHQVSLSQLVGLYGRHCLTIAIETLLLIQCAYGEIPGSAWQCVQVHRKVYAGPTL